MKSFLKNDLKGEELEHCKPYLYLYKQKGKDLKI